MPHTVILDSVLVIVMINEFVFKMDDGGGLANDVNKYLYTMNAFKLYK